MAEETKQLEEQILSVKAEMFDLRNQADSVQAQAQQQLEAIQQAYREKGAALMDLLGKQKEGESDG